MLRPAPPRPPRETTYDGLLFAATVTLGSFLVFQVQPLIGRYILPWFGSSPGVWTTCMLFFQALLLAGYAYAHALSARLTPRAQTLLHVALLIAAALTLPITPSAELKPTDASDPTARIMLLLLLSVGAPYLLLASGAPLIQRWYARARPSASPYRLYSLSNVGSLLALLSYPLVFERLWTLETQTRTWSWTFVAYALLCTACALRARRRDDAEP
ncbi:MAG: ferrichrome ABC transporter permease, partial [Myxococcales bacterium]|nr:ferrichrome ABC transporter permease [Myxococcales bacterium]